MGDLQNDNHLLKISQTYYTKNFSNEYCTPIFKHATQFLISLLSHSQESTDPIIFLLTCHSVIGEKRYYCICVIHFLPCLGSTAFGCFFVFLI